MPNAQVSGFPALLCPVLLHSQPSPSPPWVGLGSGVALGSGDSVGVAVGSGVALGVALASGVSVGVALGSGVALGVALGVGVGALQSS